MEQCGVGQFAVSRHDESRIPVFVHSYVSGSHDKVVVFVTRRRETAHLSLEVLLPISYQQVTSGLVGFEAAHTSYGKGVVQKEILIENLLHVHIHRDGDSQGSGPVPINEVMFGPPRQQR